MQRLTKAAIATGGAAVLLMGGAGTMAYWTGTATDINIAAIPSGSFEVEAGSCGPWTYAPPSSGNVGDPATGGGIVPGDTVTTICKYTLTAVGDHVALGGATVTNPVWTNPGNNLTTALGFASVSSISVTGGSSTTDISTNGQISPPLQIGATSTVSVGITVTFPYGSSAETDLQSTQNLSATLAGIEVTLIQGNLPYNYPAPAATPAP